MDLVEAIEFSKKFPNNQPKVFKGFVEWGIWDTETDGYVVLTDHNFADEKSYNQLKNYAKAHKLRLDRVKDYLMICTP
jgi:hypothetical protein